MKKQLTWKMAALIVISVLLTFIGCKKNSDFLMSKTAGMTTTTEVKRVSVQEKVTVSGNIGPVRNRFLGFSIMGKITAIEVSEGQHVTKGTIMARIDASSDEYNIEAKQYELQQAKYTAPPRKIKLMEKELLSLKKNMENKVIMAPFDGTIAKITQREGEVVSQAGDRYLIQFTDESALKASVAVDELDISRIELRQEVNFTFDAVPGEVFKGTVSKIAHIGRINQQGLTVVDIELTIKNPDPRIIIPYSFKADIIVSAPAEYLVIDDRSVIWEDDKVYVDLVDPEDPGHVIRKEIKIKLWRDGRVIILEGLKEGDNVLVMEDVPESGNIGIFDMDM